MENWRTHGDPGKNVSRLEEEALAEILEGQHCFSQGKPLQIRPLMRWSWFVPDPKRQVLNFQECYKPVVKHSHYEKTKLYTLTVKDITLKTKIINIKNASIPNYVTHLLLSISLGFFFLFTSFLSI